MSKKDFAPGLPSKTGFAPIKGKTGNTRLVIQEHDATTKHYDMRLQEGKNAHSWVIRSLPGEKNKLLAIQQPTHRSEYLNFEGTIESGYGAGTVKKVYDEKVKVLEASNDKIKMIMPEGTFTMIKPKGFGDKNWLMIKNSSFKQTKHAAFIDELEKIASGHIKQASRRRKVRFTIAQQAKDPFLGFAPNDPENRLRIAYADALNATKQKLEELKRSNMYISGIKKRLGPIIKIGSIHDAVTTKPKYKVINDVDYSDDTKVLQPKIDGSHSVFALNPKGKNEIYSYRTSKRTGEQIDHTDQVPYLRDLRIPKSLSGTVLRGELFGKTDGKPMAAEQVGGILNASVNKSLEKQKELGKLQPYIYDIVKFKGKDVSNEPYAVKFDLLKKIESQVPALRVADTAFTEKQKQRLVNSIKLGKHPDTKEGVVQWDVRQESGNPAKLKFRDNYDVYIRSVYPAIDKSGKEKNEAGGFEYSLTPKGKIVGNVGTGFDRPMKKDMLKNPEDYIGLVARVKSQQQFASGALRAPAYYDMHVEKNLEKQSMDFNQIKYNAFINELNKIASGESMPTKLILVRHGETKLNADGDKIRGWKNIPLDEHGQEEARKAAKKLVNKDVDVILSSDLIRAVDTAKALSNKIGVPVKRTKQLRPWNLGKLSGQHSKDVLNVIADYASSPNKKVEGGESFNDFKNRYLDFLKDIKNKYQGKRVAIFTHHRNDRLLSAWEKKGMPDSKRIDLSTFLKKGIEPGKFREVILGK